MSLAEPLLTAARRLLERGAPRQEPVQTRYEVNGHRTSEATAVANSRELVSRALATARQLSPSDDPRFAQVRSLLRDAASALSR
jgi:hypothetical protein